MLRTLSTSNMAELMTRAPSVWDSYDPTLDEPMAPKALDPTETPVEHMIFVLEAKIASSPHDIVFDDLDYVELVDTTEAA